MKIATWNVNSIRIRIDQVIDWLETNQVDVLCLQETKVIESGFPYSNFTDIGYHCYVSGQKAYNGVAIISKQELSSVSQGFAPVLGAELAGDFDIQKRVITGIFDGIRVICVYVPNGGGIIEKYHYKLYWLKLLHSYLEKFLLAEQPICICGDFNIVPDNRDIHFIPNENDPVVGTTEIERQLLAKICDLGLTDVFRKFCDQAENYSWWDYREASFRRNLGWRIDHIYTTQGLVDRATSCLIDAAPRKLLKPSDHTPVIAEFS
jgi:exodeoxyribonuclease-3